MKKSVVVVAASLALASVNARAQRGIALNGASLMPVESKIVEGQPYSAEIVSESVQALADGNRIVRKTTGRVYRDSAGRTRREEDRASGRPSISINDVVALRSYSLNVEQRTADVTGFLKATWSTGPGGDVAVSLNILSNKLAEMTAELAMKQKLVEAEAAGIVPAQGRGARGGAPEEEAKIARRGVNPAEETVEDRLPDRLIGSVLASGTRRTTTIAAGAIGNVQPIRVVSEEWFSPDLQILVQTEHTDPRFGRSTYQVLNINRNEPDPSLFQVPADYTIRGIGGGGRGARGGRQ